MRNKERLYNRVLDVLTCNKKSRENNMSIVKATYKTYKMPLSDKRILMDAFDVLERNNLPSFESITREARRVRMFNPELRGTDKAMQIRQDEFDAQYKRAKEDKVYGR